MANMSSLTTDCPLLDITEISPIELPCLVAESLSPSGSPEDSKTFELSELEDPFAPGSLPDVPPISPDCFERVIIPNAEDNSELGTSVPAPAAMSNKADTPSYFLGYGEEVERLTVEDFAPASVSVCNSSDTPSCSLDCCGKLKFPKLDIASEFASVSSPAVPSHMDDEEDKRRHYLQEIYASVYAQYLHRQRQESTRYAYLMRGLNIKESKSSSHPCNVKDPDLGSDT